MGRRTILNHKLIEKLCTVLRQGTAITSACAIAGIGKSSYFKWEGRGLREIARLDALEEDTPAEGEAIYVDFAEAVARARATANFNLDRVIKTAATGTPGRLATKDRPAQEAVAPDFRAALAWKQSSVASDWNQYSRARNKSGKHVIDSMLESSGSVTPKITRMFARRMATDRRASEAAAYLQEILDEIIEEYGGDE